MDDSHVILEAQTALNHFGIKFTALSEEDQKNLYEVAAEVVKQEQERNRYGTWDAVCTMNNVVYEIAHRYQ